MSAISSADNRHADDLAGALDAHRHRLALRQAGHDIVHAAGLAAADLQDQLRRPLDAGHVVVEVDAALEAVRRVAREVVAPRTAGDRVRERRTRPRAGRRACRDPPSCCRRP